MYPAPTLNDILMRSYSAETDARTSALHMRVVSIIFASPDCLAIKELKSNRQYLDLKTRNAWDLFFAGYYAYTEEPDGRLIYFPDGQCWGYSAAKFEALERALTVAARPTAWEFSGTVDLVSFICYHGLPDWDTLVSRQIAESDGSVRERLSLGEIARGLYRWSDDRMRPDLAPGEFRRATLSTRSLDRALRWTATAIGGGIAGNVAYDLLRELIT